MHQCAHRTAPRLRDAIRGRKNHTRPRYRARPCFAPAGSTRSIGAAYRASVPTGAHRVTFVQNVRVTSHGVCGASRSRRPLMRPTRSGRLSRSPFTATRGWISLTMDESHAYLLTDRGRREQLENVTQRLVGYRLSGSFCHLTVRAPLQKSWHPVSDGQGSRIW